MFRFLIVVILILFPWHISIAETDSIISKIQTGWNDIQTMSGEFSQIDSDGCLLYTSPSPRDATLSRMPSSA